MRAIESTGAQALDQLLRIMLPRFMAQVCRKNTSIPYEEIQCENLVLCNFIAQPFQDYFSKIKWMLNFVSCFHDMLSMLNILCYINLEDIDQPFKFLNISILDNSI